MYNLKLKKYNEDKHIYYKNKYEQSPKLCKFCGEVLSYEIRKHMFCNSSHAASYNNKTSIKRKAKTKLKYINNCKECGKQFTFTGKAYIKEFCNNKCQNTYTFKLYVYRWKNGLESGIVGKRATSHYIKRYLIELYGKRCMKCGQDEINPSTLESPIHLHHIDGDFTNNSENNLELLCPNCHSITPNFGSLNMGKSTREF